MTITLQLLVLQWKMESLLFALLSTENVIDVRELATNCGDQGVNKEKRLFSLPASLNSFIMPLSSLPSE